MHLDDVQGTDKTIMFLRQFRKNHGLLPSLLSIAHSWFHTFSGLSESPLCKPSTRAPHLLHGWFKTLYGFLRRAECSLWFSPQVEQKILPRRDHDRVLMNDICASKVSDTTVTQLNCVRLYLRAETLSDLCNERGTSIHSGALTYERAAIIPKSKKSWPIQAKPSEKMFEKWAKYIRAQYCKKRSNKLQQKLGRWHQAHHEMEWPAYFDPDLKFLLVKSETGWKSLPVSDSGHTYQGGCVENTTFDTVISLPASTIPVYYHDNTCDMPHPDYDYPLPQTSSPAPQYFSDYVRSLPRWEQQLLGTAHEVSQESPTLLELMSTSEGVSSLLIGHDGGAYPGGPFKNYGSHGWVIATEDRVLWAGNGPVVGFPDNPSFRTETVAHIGAMRFLFHQYKFWNIDTPEGTLHLSTDSESMMKSTAKLESFGDKWFSAVFTWHHIDALQQLHYAALDLQPLALQRSHVKGHSDRKKKWESMSRQEQINVLCDEYATEALIKQHSDGPPQFAPLPNTTCYLRKEGQFVTSHEDKILLWTAAARDLKRFYAKKHKWSEETAAQVNYNALESAISSLGQFQGFIPKHLCKWLPTFDHLERREGLNPKCPHCPEIESNDHMLSCNFRSTLHKTIKRSLTSTLIHLQTCPRVQREMMYGVSMVFGLLPDNVLSDFSPEYGRQSEIGWFNLFRGMIATGWQKRQEQYSRFLSARQKKKTPQWSKQVIVAFIKASKKIWVERCHNANDKTSKYETQQERRRAEAAVRAAYRHYDHIGSSDREQIFEVPLEDRLKQPAKSLLLWYDNTKTSLKTAISDYARHLEREESSTRNIPEFFRKLPSQPRRKSRRRRRSSYSTQPAQQTSPTRRQRPRRSISLPRTLRSEPRGHHNHESEPNHLRAINDHPT